MAHFFHQHLLSILFVLSWLVHPNVIHAQFDSLFLNKTLRFDYLHIGDARNEFFALDELLEEPYWAGSHLHLIDTFGYGKFQCRLYDQATGELIYSRGYSTLFSEWQTTLEAQNVYRAFEESVVMPFPRHDAFIEIYSRNRKGQFEKKFSYPFRVNDYFVNQKQRMVFPVFKIREVAPAEKALDIVILPEGYTSQQMEIFKQDCQKFAEILLGYSPYNEYSDKINIKAVLAPSFEESSDFPPSGIWKNTLLHSKFYTFDLDRYCMTDAFQTVRDVASNAPYDQIYILVNSSMYGGGAIFNYYALSVNSNMLAGKVFIHEFGHSFAGLADEYYDSEVAYNEFYPLDLEPQEPNITTLVNFKRKWADMIEEGTPIPTPAEEIYRNKVGVFEGGGYAAKGIYRPAMDCLMNTFRQNTFCPVCIRAIRKMLDFYTQ
ncbi:MAG TPA: M64 family metallopeptidase [Bacteroidales bacterium]|nr:peptidase M64 [Bacteroidales bacterium]MDI9573141.1 M64 family metallopeptidase [Bacteroidota bacterium]OQC60235.1 MAG: IgA Peptidase M64 [Bacteroidetes bacterium ADurb.Bin012]MBP9511542.1 peptidase M64 [Bacteroidales bacterium]MBP9588253.1 peptidase M64 [Bacteroidales bacterium]